VAVLANMFRRRVADCYEADMRILCVVHSKVGPGVKRGVRSTQYGVQHGEVWERRVRLSFRTVPGA